MLSILESIANEPDELMSCESASTRTPVSTVSSPPKPPLRKRENKQKQKNLFGFQANSDYL